MRSPTGQQQNRRASAQNDRDPTQSQQEVPASSQAPQQISQIISVCINQRLLGTHASGVLRCQSTPEACVPCSNLKSILARAFPAKYFDRVFVPGSRFAAWPPNAQKAFTSQDLASHFVRGFAA
jgi:hypothetical protein